MHIFKDNQGRSWNFALNVWEMKRIRASLGVDLVNAVALGKDGNVQADLVDRIANDPCLLVDILWVVCEEQAKEDGVSDADFGSSLAGDAVEEATRAFLDELVDFFPGARRLFLRKAVELARRYAAQTDAALKAALESPEFEAWLAASMSSSTKSPGSSE